MTLHNRKERRPLSGRSWWMKEKSSWIAVGMASICCFAVASRPVAGHPGDQLLITGDLTPVLQNFSSSNLSEQEHYDQPFIRRAEINPAWEKFATIPDDDMPGYPDWNVLAKNNFSSWDDGTWTMTVTKMLQHMYQAYHGITNGYIGCAVAVAGPFFDADVNKTNHIGPGSQPTEGWPLWDDRITFCTISGFFGSQAETPGYNYPELRRLGNESIISGIPHFLGFKLGVGDQVYDANVDFTAADRFKTKLHYTGGLNDWSVTWYPRGLNISLDIEMISHANKRRFNIAGTQLLVTARGGNVKVSVTDILDGKSALRSYLGEKGLSDNSTIYISVHPQGLPNVTAWLVSTANVSNGLTDESSRREITDPGNDMTIGQQWDVHLIENQTAIFEKFVGIASTDKFSDAERKAREESSRAFTDGFDVLLSEQAKEWYRRINNHTITSYRDLATGRLPGNDTILAALQIAAVADAYYLNQNLLPAGSGLDDEGVAVSGLTSPSYGGMTFWDQDFYMFPAVVAHWPDHARQMLEVRIKHLSQAKLNAQAQYVQDKYKFDDKSALFSWTAGRTGQATATGPVIDYEVHVNPDIALAAFTYLDVTGDETYFKEKLWPLVDAIGHSISTLLVRDREGYSIYNMTDPDEWANNRNNGAFTLGAFSTILTEITKYQKKNGLPVNETWVDMAAKVNIPKAKSGITLEYEGMTNNVTVKQADVLLMGLRLKLPNYTLKEQRQDFLYYDQKQSPDGPAMTDTISAMVMNKIGASGCSAFIRQGNAQLQFLRGPWYQMSEQANDDKNANGGVAPANPFLTASAASLQIPVFGYVGHTQLEDQVTIRPALPAPLKNLQVADFYSKGNRFRAIMNSTHTNITRLPVELPGFYDSFINQPMPFLVERRNATEDAIYATAHNITMNETVTVENDMYWQQLTIPNNFLQCQPTTSGGQYVVGNFPGAATDGDPGTRWQPLTQNASNITVDTRNVPFQRVKRISVEWGPRTPKFARVGFTNETELPLILKTTKFIELHPITNQIYGMDTPNDEVVPYKGNSTEYIVPEDLKDHARFRSGNYTILVVEGCEGCGKLVQMTHENGTKYWQDDGLGASVGEFAVIGETGMDIVQNLNGVTADERSGTKDDVVDKQEAQNTAMREQWSSQRVNT